MKDLLSLVAVSADIKPVAAYGFLSKDNESEIRRLRDRVVDLGLKTLITTAIEKPVVRYLDGFPPDVVRAYEIFEKEKDRGRDFLLWVGRDGGAISAIKRAVNAPASVGIVLGYPTCCVEHEDYLNREMQRALATAYVKAVGPEGQKVLTALRDDLGVTVETHGRMTVWQTDQVYPFVFHSACERCLINDDSPSALLNKKNEALAADLDPALHRTIVEMAELQVEFGQVCSDADEKGLSPESIDQKTRARLQDPSERCTHLADVFRAGPYTHDARPRYLGDSG
jgi:hypothetical protein